MPKFDPFDPMYQESRQTGPDFDPFSSQYHEQPEGAFGAITSGGKRTWESVKAAYNTYMDDRSALGAGARRSAVIGSTEEQDAFRSSMAENALDSDPDSWLDAIGDVVGAAWDNSTGAFHEMLAQLPNSAAVLGGMYAGAKTGAGIGTLASPGLGTTIGGITGGILGMFMGNTAVETGFDALEKSEDGLTDEERDEVIGGGLRKGAVITAFDGATIGLNKLMMGAPGRMVESAVTKSLIDEGIDVADDLAIRQALQNKDIAFRVVDAGTQAFNDATTLAKRTGRGGVGFMAETFSEGAGEYVGELAKDGEASKGEAVMEALLSMPQSVAELYVSKKLNNPGRLTQMAKQAQNQAYNDLENAESVDDAISSAQKAVHVPVAPDLENAGFMSPDAGLGSTDTNLPTYEPKSFIDEALTDSEKIDRQANRMGGTGPVAGHLNSPADMGHAPIQVQGAEGQFQYDDTSHVDGVLTDQEKNDKQINRMTGAEPGVSGLLNSPENMSHAPIQAEGRLLSESYSEKQAPETMTGGFMSPEASQSPAESATDTAPSDQAQVSQEAGPKTYNPNEGVSRGTSAPKNETIKDTAGKEIEPVASVVSDAKKEPVSTGNVKEKDLGPKPEAQETQGQTVEAAAAQAATNPANDLSEPTEGQKEAGNYQKGHVRIQGLDISIENPKGSTRSGVSPEGKEWSQRMRDHYGDIKRTEGPDGDNVDVFIGPEAESGSPKVFVIDQVNPNSGRFDEHKVMLGYPTVEAAKKAYLRNYEKGWKGMKAVTPVEMETFKTWLKEGDTKSEFTKYADLEAGALKARLDGLKAFGRCLTAA